MTRYSLSTFSQIVIKSWRAPTEGAIKLTSSAYPNMHMTSDPYDVYGVNSILSAVMLVTATGIMTRSIYLTTCFVVNNDNTKHSVTINPQQHKLGTSASSLKLGILLSPKAGKHQRIPTFVRSDMQSHLPCNSVKAWIVFRIPSEQN